MATSPYGRMDLLLPSRHGFLRDNERDPRLPWNAGKTGIMVAVVVTSVTCDGDDDAAASCAECTAMCAEMTN